MPVSRSWRTPSHRHRLAACVLGLAALVTSGCGDVDAAIPLPTASLPDPTTTDVTVALSTIVDAPPEAASLDPVASPVGDAAAPPSGDGSVAGSPPPGSDPAVIPTSAPPQSTDAPVPPADAAPAAAPARPAPPASGQGVDVRAPDKYAFTCKDDEATVAASGAARVTLGTATIYAGTQQVTGDNQDPRVARFDAGVRSWCRDDLERNNDDGRGYGLLWSSDLLYVVFSATGTQGDASGDLRRFTRQGWLATYSDASPGGGGGAKVSTIVQLDPATGDGVTGSWLTALNNGKTNSLVVTGLTLDADGLTVGAKSWFLPRGADRSAMNCTGGSPFVATYRFSRDLSTVASATAESCTAG